MRVCLIAAPTVSQISNSVRPDAIVEELQDAPLGVLSLAAVLEQRQLEPHLVFPNLLYHRYLSTVSQLAGADFCRYAADHLGHLPVDVFGFSSICSSYPLTIRIAAELRRLRPEVTIIFGGPQASVVDQETLDAFSWIDFVVRGEAEETFPALLDALSRARAIEDVPGLTFRSGTRVVRNQDAPVIQDLDCLPIPAFHLYRKPSPVDYVPLELGRGCPFACTFCSTNDFFRRRFRLKSPERMLEQMTAVQEEYGVQRFELVHDMFTVDRKRVVEFCQTLRASGKDFTWACSARTDCIDDELIDLMAEAGCRGIFFGIETGSARMQTLIDKRLDLQRSREAVRYAESRDVGTTVSLIIGFPEETIEDVRATAHFLLDVLPYDNVETHLHLLAPLAKTPLHARYRDALTLEDTSSTLSNFGWEPNTQDVELVNSHPDIFSSFYLLPTKLPHRYLEEIRAFLLCAKSQFRWLLLALYEYIGDIVRVFDSWKQWRERRHSKEIWPFPMQYYLDSRFVEEFFEFLHSYIPDECGGDVRIWRLLTYEFKWREAARNLQAERLEGGVSNPVTLESEIDAYSIPTLPQGARLAPIDPEAAKVIRHLKSKGQPSESVASIDRDFLYVRSIDSQSSESLYLSPLAAHLLELCDGDSTLGHICTQFAITFEPIPSLRALSAEQICISGVLELAQQGLLAFKPRPSQSSFGCQSPKLDLNAATGSIT